MIHPASSDDIRREYDRRQQEIDMLLERLRAETRIQQRIIDTSWDAEE